MRVHLIFTIYFLCAMGLAQTDSGRLSPVLTTMIMDPGTVTVLHLADGYSTSVKVPEEISSVVIGNPSRFKAEHSDSEPQLVFLKPTGELQCESNALITTKSSKEINLYLVSRGKPAPNARVDFFIEYERPGSLGITADRRSFLIPETALAAESPIETGAPRQQPDYIAEELETQKALSAPQWEGTELLAAVGKSVEHDDHTILGFSVFNGSKRIIEILPPQLELSGTGRRNGAKQIKAESVPISEYRITARKLEPGHRADGVVVFERPSFKESSERLQLQLAEADEVERPLLVPVPFTFGIEGEVQ
jgi:hypothetical protein